MNLSIPTRTMVLLMAAALLVTVTPELGSENVTLSTYYPAPSGVYNKMITTGNTYLATSNGSVGIGTTAPAANLDVGTTASCCATGVNAGGNPTLGISEATSTNNRLPWIQFHAAGAQEAFLRLARNDRTIEIGDNQGAGAALALLDGSRNRGVFLNPRGYSYVNGGSLGIGSINAPGSHKGYLYIDAESQASCGKPIYYNFGTTGWGSVCTGVDCSAGGLNCYATFTQGLYINGWAAAGHGGQAMVQRANVGTQPGSVTSQVLALTPGTSINLGSVLRETFWGVMKPPSTGFFVYCCPK
ncbi:MAG: hypothetical protein PHU21_13410 [Elusimicrobia bacterium]|nr:hypothetical protein [Elusimicrobiota bacterium]